MCIRDRMIAAPAAFVFRYVYFFPLCMPLFLLLPFLPEGRYSRMHWRADTETIPMEPMRNTIHDEKAVFPEPRDRSGDGYTHWKD